MEIADVNNLVRVLNKILQGYRIRAKCMNRRSEISHYLQFKVYRERGQISEDLYRRAISELKNLIKYDKRNMIIVTKEEEGVENPLVYAFRILRSHHHIFLNNPKDKQLNKELKKYGLSIKELEKACASAIVFLEELQRSFPIIIERIKKETEFIEEPNEDNFYKFSRALGDEMNFHRRLLRKLNDIITLRFERVRKYGNLYLVGNGIRVIGPALSLGAGGAFAGAGISFVTNNPNAATLGGGIGIAVGALIGIAIFAREMKGILTEIKEIDLKDYEIEKALIESKGKIIGVGRKPYS